MEELRDILIRQAKDCGVCVDGYGRLNRLDRKALLEYYKVMVDWCLENHYPTLQVIADNFADCAADGIFVGRTFHGETLSGAAYVFHGCKGWVRVAMDYDKCVIPMMYFANGSKMTVKCDQKRNAGNPICVPLYVYDAEVKAEDGEFAVFRHINREIRQ